MSGITLGESGPAYAVPGFDGTRVPFWGSAGRSPRVTRWVGTINDGVYRISGGVADHYGVSDGLSGNQTWGSFLRIEKETSGCSPDGGLDKFPQHGPDYLCATRQGVSDSEFHSVMALRNGAVLIGTSSALNILRKQDGKTAIFDRKLSGQQVFPMLEDHNRGGFWLEVGFSLMRIQNGRFREVGGQSFASLGGVSGISEDSGGTIWVLTPRGY